MNTNQFMFNPTVAPYWNPITLASNIKKTPSYESLSAEEKIQRRLDRMETAVEDCNYIINNYNENIKKFMNRIKTISDKSSQYMKEFYEESPDYQPDNMFDTLIWLSHSNEEKKDILDKELEEYFN